MIFNGRRLIFRAAVEDVDDFARFGEADAVFVFPAVETGGQGFAVKGQIAAVLEVLTALQAGEIEKLGVGEVGRDDVLQGGEHGFNAAGEAFVPIAHHVADDLAL